MRQFTLVAVCLALTLAEGAAETCEFLPVPKMKPVKCTQLSDELGPESQEEYGRVARRMCRKHQQDYCDMPARFKTSPCPAAGESADILEFPHMALLGYGDGDSREFSCGGSLISPTFVLTAAHCRLGPQNKPMRVVVLGATNRTSTSTTSESTRQEIPVAEVIAHPEYRPPVKYNDIALVRLARPALLGPEDVTPACLHTDMDPSHLGEEAVATGWGATGWGEDASETLIKVNLTVRSMHHCADRMQLDAEQSPRGLLAATQLCAGGGSHGRDTCQGDSGGPLQVRADPQSKSPCMHRILGVVSFGPFCGLGLPGIYTRVASFIPWIESIVWPSEADACVRTAPFKDGKPSNRTLLIPSTGPGTVARRMCRAYHVDFCKQYRLESRLVSPGITPKTRCHHNRPDRDFSKIAISTGVLKYGSNSYDTEYACTGSLISLDYVLTAAHCLKLGCLPVSTVVLTLPGQCHSIYYDVDSFVKHPSAESEHRYDSLALIKLRTKVDLLDAIPACLHTDRSEKMDRKSLTTQGFASSGDWEKVSLMPYAKQLQVRPWQSCRGLMAGVDPLLPDSIAKQQFCAGAGEAGRCINYSYPGHPGAAVVRTPHALLHEVGHNERPVPELIGVEAFSSACGAGLPDVFTAVSHYIPWIESVVWPDEK